MNLPEQMYTDFQEQIPALKEALATGATYATELGQRIIKWDIALNSFYIILFSILIVICILPLKKILSMYKESEYGDDTAVAIAIVYFICSPILFLVSFLSIFVDCFPAIIKAIFIPELRLLEILSKLIQ